MATNGNAVMDGSPPAPKKVKGSPKGTIEKIYQKKTQLEHILLRPDTYIGKYIVLSNFSSVKLCIDFIALD